MRITKRFFPLCGRKGRTSKPNIRKPHDVFYRFRFPYGPQPGPPARTRAGSHLSDGDADFRDGPGLQASFGERGCRPRFPEATSPTDRLSDETIRQVRRTGKHPAKDIFRDRFGKSSGSDRRIAAARFPQRGKPVCVREKPDRSQPRTGTALHSTEDDPTVGGFAFAKEKRHLCKTRLPGTPAPESGTLSRTHSKTT